MKTRILIPIIAVSIMAAAGVLLFAPSSPAPVEQRKIDFTAYDEVNLALKTELAEHQILMSSPIRISGTTDIKKYCTIFADPGQQNLIRYCTSTELTDGDGTFLGNIYAVGELEVPQVVLALVQTDAAMSEINTVKTVFGALVNRHVCECWEDVTPDGFETVGTWIDGLGQFHASDTRPHSKSKQIALDQKVLQMEITTNKDGYLWNLFIYS